jgi:hypothetical protein
MTYISLEESHPKDLKDREFLISKMAIKEHKPHYVSSFCNVNEFLATYCLYVSGEIDRAKDCYYEAAMAMVYCVEKLGHDPFGVKQSLYAVLSDNNAIIERYSRYQTKETGEQGAFPVHYGAAVQAVVRNDFAELEKRIAVLLKRTQSGVFKKMAGSVDVFQGISEGDKSKIENGLVDITKKTKNDQPPVIRDYMNINATGLAKLAWRSGLEVNINSTFIPQALLPIKELEHYESYDFFEDLKL